MTSDPARIAAALAGRHGGTWTRASTDAGDHPTRLEAIEHWTQA
jgi:hypothetical protein